MQPRTLARKIAALALSKKARDIMIMDLRKLTDMADYFVVCSADSETQVKAIADAVVDGTERLGVPVWQSEGMAQRQWALLDYVDVVVHVFHREVRKFYNLEKLWGDSLIEAVQDEAPPARKRSTRVRRTEVRRRARVSG